MRQAYHKQHNWMFLSLLVLRDGSLGVIGYFKWCSKLEIILDPRMTVGRSIEYALWQSEWVYIRFYMRLCTTCVHLFLGICVRTRAFARYRVHHRVNIHSPLKLDFTAVAVIECWRFWRGENFQKSLEAGPVLRSNEKEGEARRRRVICLSKGLPSSSQKFLWP